jgi:trimeric autotransporter adhesin
MKTIKIFLTLICIIFFQKIELYSQAPTNGLMAYFPFTGNTNDASGNNRNGAITGSISPTTDRFGVANQAYAFNGSVSSKITVSNWNILTGNAPRTMMVWFKTKVVNPTRYNMFLTWGTNQISASSALGTLANNTINGEKYLGFWGYNNNLFITEQLQYYDDQWHLIVVTFDGSNLSLFIDGAFITNKTTTLSTASSALIIGNSRFDNEGFDVSMTGSLDDIRIYNRALTANEVQQTYIAEAPTSSTAEIIKLGSDKFIHATGNDNTFVGLRSGAFSTGYSNTFFGIKTGVSTSGDANTFIGTNAGFKNTTGRVNTFVGQGTGYENTTGTYNTFIGNGAGLLNVVGSSNTLVGHNAGYKTTGTGNVQIGVNSGVWSTTGENNTYLGYYAGSGVIETTPNTGSYNTYIGNNAGGGTTTGTYNTFLGLNAGVTSISNSTGSFNVYLGSRSGGLGTNGEGLQRSAAIGYNARVSINNAIVLGDFENANLKVGIGVHDPQFKLDVKGPINIRGINGGLGELKFMSYNFLQGDKNFNSAIGFMAEVDSQYVHSTAIGYKSYASANNVLVLGGINENTVNVGIGNTAPKDNLEITSGKEGKSGLMFSNLNSETAISSNTNQVLSVDKMGRVGLYGISAVNIQLKVNSENDWSDKVFSTNYKLMPIYELEKYIQDKQHLPNIPSANEMKEKGISVESMSAITVEKIEEIILYLIEMKKEFKVVKEKVIHLENENRGLKKALKRKK